MKYKDTQNLGKEMNRLEEMKLREKLIASITQCIHVDFEHAQYRFFGPGLGIGTSVWDALDDALFNLAETRHGALSDIADNEHVLAAFEQLMQEYKQSKNYAILPRLYWNSDKETDYSLDFDLVQESRCVEVEPEQNLEDGITIIDGYILDLDSAQYKAIPSEIKQKIQRDIDNCEHYVYIDLDEQEIRDLLADYEDDLAAQ